MHLVDWHPGMEGSVACRTGYHQPHNLLLSLHVTVNHDPASNSSTREPTSNVIPPSPGSLGRLLAINTPGLGNSLEQTGND